MKYYFAFDVETTGQFLTKNAIIAFGCTVMNENYKEIDSFEGYMNIPDDRSFEKRCYDEFWSKQKEILESIKKKMQDPKEVMDKFVKWMDCIDLKYGDDLIVLSDTAGYDYAWLDMYLSLFTDRYSLYYRLKDIKDSKRIYEYRRTWDTNSMYNGALMEKKNGKFIEWNLEKELSCQTDKFENDHNPLTDARNIAANYILFCNQYNGKGIKI